MSAAQSSGKLGSAEESQPGFNCCQNEYQGESLLFEPSRKCTTSTRPLFLQVAIKLEILLGKYGKAAETTSFRE